MQKSNENGREKQLDIKRIIIGGAIGIAVMCMMCLMMACLVIFKLVPSELTALYAAISGLVGGFLAAAAVGAKGKILIYVPSVFVFMSAMVFLLGELIFSRPFSLSSNPYMMIALLFGLSLGSAVVNRR